MIGFEHVKHCILHEEQIVPFRYVPDKQFGTQLFVTNTEFNESE